MNKLLKYIGYFLAGFITLLFLAVVILKFIPDEQYRDWIISATKSATGRDLSIENLELDIGTAFRVRADNIRMANTDWASQPDMLRINRIEIDLGLLALLAGKADIRAVVEQGEVFAENNADGISNWIMGTGDPEAEIKNDEEFSGGISEPPLQPFIREIRIDDFKITFIKEPGAAVKYAHLKQLLIETPETDTTISLSADINGKPVELSGNLGNVEQLLYDASEPVHLTGDINGDKLNISGNWGPLFPTQTMLVDIDLKIPSSARLAVLAGLGEEEFGAIDISGRITAEQSVLSLNPLHISLDGPNAAVTIDGEIADLNNMQGFNIAVDANTSTLAKLIQQLGIELPTALPPQVEFSTRINGGLRELQLSDLVVVAKDEGMEIKATAAVGDLLHLRKITGTITGNVDSLAQLSKYAKIDLPGLGRLQLSGDLASHDSSLQLDNLDVRLVSDNINVEVTGKVTDLLTISGVDALAKADVRSFSKQNITELTKMFKQFGTELQPDMLPQSLKISTAIQGSLEQLSLSDIQGEVLDKDVKVALSGKVGDVLQASGLDVELTLDTKSVSALSKFAGSELPQTEPLKVLARLTEDESKKPKLAVHAETGGVKIDINSLLESLAVTENLAFGVSVKAASMSNFNQLAEIEFPDEGPFDLSAQLQVQKDSYAINNLKIQLKKQSATGNMAIKLPATETLPTSINGKLNISYLDLSFLLAEDEELPAEGETASPDTEQAAAEETQTADNAETQSTSNESEVNTDRLFSSDPFLRELLHKYEIDLDVEANKIKIGKSDIQNVEAVVTLKDGLFSADPIKGAGGAGNINGFIHIDGRGEIPELKVDMAILQVPTPSLGGKLDFNADLTGKGKSVAELMASLNGRILIVMRDGRIEGKMAKKLGSGLLSFSGEKDYTTLECGILRVDIEDGIANFERKLAAQLTEVMWRGGGTVNLKTEKLDAGIVPKPRKGIPISVTGSLSGLVHVGGTLKHPQVQLDPKDVAVKYAKYSAYVASGGLTLIAEKIKDKIQANQDVCKKILDGTVFDNEGKKKEKSDKKADKKAQQTIEEEY